MSVCYKLIMMQYIKQNMSIGVWRVGSPFKVLKLEDALTSGVLSANIFSVLFLVLIKSNALINVMPHYGINKGKGGD